MVDTVFKFFADLWNQVVVLFTTVNNPVFDIIDIIIVTFIIYKAILFMRQTRAEQLIKGIFILLIAYLVARWFNLRALLWIMSMIYLNAIVVVFVLFQPEFRSALERMGRGSFKKLGRSLSSAEVFERIGDMIDSVCKACQIMQKDKVGALIVLERSTMLGEIIATGTVIDSKPSSDLICNVFFPKSPLHDGAMIIREDKLYAAGCILPLTQNKTIDNDLGTRHRAAIGVSEISDAVVVVVSEETGIISIAANGTIERNFNIITLKEQLEHALLGTQSDDSDKKGILKILKRLGRKEK